MEKTKRQRGRLRNIHTRIPEQDYLQINEICEKLNISFADYFNRAIHAHGYDDLQQYARKINNEPRKCKIEMDIPTKESIDSLSMALNSQSVQIRRIGTNLSNLIVKGGIDSQVLVAMRKELNAALHHVHAASSRLVDILYDDKAITKVECRGHDMWED